MPFERIHGYGNSRNVNRESTYRSWEAMKQRCNNPTHWRYHKYGGRGITYDPRWENFVEFLVDMGECPEGLSLERKDTNGNYNKDNCKWATDEEQQNNRTNNRKLTWDGETLSIAQWERKLGWRTGSISQRINKLGWSVERALTTIPKIGRNQNG